MTLETPLWLGAVGDPVTGIGDDPINYSARQLRTFIDALVTSEGVCGIPDLKLVQHSSGANGTVDAGPGSCVIKGDNASGQGKYLQRSTAVEVVSDIPSAPVSGTRHHLVVARVRDKQSIPGDTLYDWHIYTVPDVGGGRPAVPLNAIPLGEVRRYSGQTGIANTDITDLRPFAAGLDASPWTSKTVKTLDRITRRFTTGADSAYTWAHTLGRTPVGGLGQIVNYETVSGAIPTGLIVELDTATPTTVKLRVLGTGTFGLYPSRACSASVELW